MTLSRFLEFPDELTYRICSHLGVDTIYRLAATCTLFKNQISDYKLMKRSRRAATQENMKSDSSPTGHYVRPTGKIPYGIYKYNQLLIGVDAELFVMLKCNSSDLI
jgi:hypothetical protein